ncbi:MAG: hypothetical protein JSU99_04770 [Nitrospiraceae bacterium]|nr:MAG: hypothetical protein JSU99_04770 [Nitrospiraceae bacterium]
MTLDELKQYCNGELQNIDRIMNELYSLYEPDKVAYSLAEQAALATFIVNTFSGIENILKQMLLYDKLEIDSAPGWHEKVLRKAGEIGIVPPELLQKLSGYLSFRNYFIYSYIFNIKWDDMKPLVDEIKDAVAQIRSEIEEYLQTI